MPVYQKTAKKYFFKKSLGQNILIDKNIVKKIVASLNVDNNDLIIEIGAGSGALTDELIKRPNKLIAVEKDTRFAKKLKERYSKQNIQIINDDALKIDYKSISGKYNQKLTVIGNLPYNVSTQILFLLFDSISYFKSFLFMFQKEVAKRITASPPTKDYGILSVISQYYSRPKMLMTVPGSCFKPRPKVESAVVGFDIFSVPPFLQKDENLFRNVVKTAFAHRRKTLNNCFKGFKYDDVLSFNMDEIFANAGIDSQKRAETLGVEEFAHLTETLYDAISKKTEDKC